MHTLEKVIFGSILIIIILALAVFAVFSLKAEAPSAERSPLPSSDLQLLSIEQMGSAEDDSPQGLAVDETGVYIAGETEGNLYKNNAAGENSVTTPNASYTRNDGVFNMDAPEDAFISKFSLDGKTLLWSEQFGTTAYDSARGIAINDSGVYVAGTTEGDLEGDLIGFSDLFLRKYSQQGELLWSKQWGSSKMDEGLWVVSEEDRVCVGGGTLGQLGAEPKSGDEDVFATCFNNEGEELWTLQFGSEKFEEALGAILVEGNLYLAGATSGALEEAKKAKQEDAYVAKINVEGDLEFVKQFGSSSTDFGHDVSVYDEVIYSVGRTEGSFGKKDPAGLSDAILSAFSSDGSELFWAEQFGTADGDTARALTASKHGIFVAGVINGKLEKHGPETNLEDGFIRLYDFDGELLFETILDSGGYDDPRDLTVENNILYVVGQSGGEWGNENHGAWDIFLARYDLTN